MILIKQLFPLLKNIFFAYFDFKGRTARKRFFLFFILYSFVDMYKPILTLPLVIPYIAIEFRRLHDFNRSGMWVFLPLILMSIPTYYFFSESQKLLIYAWVIHLVFSVLLIFVKGTPGPNRFGQPPEY